MKCNSIINFSKIQNTGSNMTIGFNKGFVNYLKSSIGLTESNSTFFAASDSTNEIVGVQSDYNDSMAALAVWGIDSSEKDVNRDFIGLLDDESFSIFVMVDLNIYQINQTLSYSQNGIVIFDENNRVSEVCYTEPTQDNYDKLVEASEGLSEELILAQDSVATTPTQTTLIDEPIIVEDGVDESGFYESGFSDGVASVDITSDNEAVFNAGYREGVASVDITSDNQIAYTQGYEDAVSSIIPEDGVTQEDLDVLQLKISALESYQAQMVDSNHSLIVELDTKKKIVGFSLVALLFLLVSKK